MFLANRHVRKPGEPLSSDDAWSYGSWEYIKIATDERLPQEIAAHERIDLFLAGGPARDDSGERTLQFASDLQILVYPDLSLTELDFGGTYLDWGNDKYIERGGLEDEFQWSAEALDVIARAFPPAWGRLGEHVPMPYIFSKEAPAMLDSRKLPRARLWWINVFGPGYVEGFGKDFLLGAPGYRKEEVTPGCIVHQITKDFLVFGEPDPAPADVEAYFRAHPNGRRAKYKALLAKELIPRRYRAIMEGRGGSGRPRRT